METPWPRKRISSIYSHFLLDFSRSSGRICMRFQKFYQTNHLLNAKITHKMRNGQIFCFSMNISVVLWAMYIYNMNFFNFQEGKRYCPSQNLVSLWLIMPCNKQEVWQQSSSSMLTYQQCVRLWLNTDVMPDTIMETWGELVCGRRWQSHYWSHLLCSDIINDAVHALSILRELEQRNTPPIADIGTNYKKL